jgi:hypothetical protein
MLELVIALIGIVIFFTVFGYAVCSSDVNEYFRQRFYCQKGSVCGYDVLIPKAISLTSRQHIVDIITNAHNKWYYPNKNNINFNNVHFYSSNIDAGGKFTYITKSYYEYAPDYKVAVSYKVHGYYEYPLLCDDKNIPLPSTVLHQYLYDIKINLI